MAFLDRCHSLRFPFRTEKISQFFQLPPMLPSLLILSNVTISIGLCSLTSEHEGARHSASRREHYFDRHGIRPLVTPTLLKPRITFPYLMGPNWIVDQHDFTCMLPIATAAALMQDFYEELAAYAATTLTPASPSCDLWLGQILLEIVAPPSVVVEWILIQRFALEMLKFTKRGYTNTYQINFIHRPTGMLITFSLYTGMTRTAA